MALLLLSGCGSSLEEPSTASGPGKHGAGTTAFKATALSFSTNENTTLQAQLATNSTGPVTYSIALQPLSGAIALNANTGQFTYAPNQSFIGIDQFTYRAHDASNNLAANVVTIRVNRANVPPVFPQIAAPPVVGAGISFDVTLQAQDPDGVIAGYQVAQTSGELLTKAQINGQTLSVSTPESSFAHEVTLHVTAFDDKGASAARSLTFTIAPTLAGSSVRTVIGSPNRAGVHWVITGDGYTLAEQDKLVVDAMSVAKYVLETPVISSYAAVWNVHVMSAVSEQSGVDVPWEGVAVNTAFDGRLGCNGIPRVLCMNDAKVLTAVHGEPVEADFVLVLSNTERYGGAAGSIATATTHASAAITVLHEMGHHFAGLGDEYVDPLAADSPAVYFEGLYPNVTQQTSIDAIPWQLWLQPGTALPTQATQPGVGLFEGAFYSPAGFYRPTADSFMRSVSRELGSVNAEAWAIANYAVVGPVLSSSPVARTVSATSDTPARIEIRPTFGPVQQIRWSIDGVDQPDRVNQPSITCCAVPGTHVVAVIVFDSSGNIRKLDARTFYGRTWEVTIQP